MSDVDQVELEALTDELYADGELGPGYMLRGDCEHLAKRFLASSWLAHEREQTVTHSAVVHVSAVAADTEEYARIYNIGYEDAMAHEAAPIGRVADAAVWLEEQRQEACEEERREWASWLANWIGAARVQPPTPQSILGWLRADVRPFGVRSVR